MRLPVLIDEADSGNTVNQNVRRSEDTMVHVRHSRVGGDDGISLTVEEDGHAHVSAKGRLTEAMAADFAEELAAVLRNADCVVLDADAMAVDDPATWDVLGSALDRAGGWPAAKLAVVVRDRSVRLVLSACAVARMVAVADSDEHATAACDRRPDTVRASWDLPADARSPSRARRLVEMRSASWGCPVSVRGDLMQVASALVTNAVHHARTSMRLVVALDGGFLHTSVRDYSTVVPVRRAAVTSGLRIVAAVADRWGCTPRPDGKTVWAVLGGPA